ncbi:hypothetical protein MA16_Dca023950 [Dendrobium catenatum]|uniref:Uncharacterized protein n=1 Tax=Dendrobium catenatum TaxID=906689 RepID=A0A2I0VJF8_9ASPA|nr:hypothetical protein MA16_Dca023950 [Dendrobium catenatum]
MRFLTTLKVPSGGRGGEHSSLRLVSTSLAISATRSCTILTDFFKETNRSPRGVSSGFAFPLLHLFIAVLPQTRRELVEMGVPSDVVGVGASKRSSFMVEASRNEPRVIDSKTSPTQAAISAFFITADKTILKHARGNTIDKYDKSSGHEAAPTQR